MINRFAPRWALPASLLLNVALVSAGVGFVLRGPPRPPSPLELENTIASRLGPDDQAILHAAFEPRRAAIKDGQTAIGGVLASVFDLLASPTLDPAALHRLLTQATATRDATDANLLAALEEALPRLSVEGRRRLSAWRPHWR